MKKQIFVQYDNSEDAMYGIGIVDDIDFKASEEKFERKLKDALMEYYPDAEVEVTTGRTCYMVDGNVDTDDAEMVGVILNRVWEAFDWMETKEKKEFTVKLQESNHEIVITEEMLQEISLYGDIPSDWGLGLEDVVWVSRGYAENDPDWDVPEGFPEHLPLWGEGF